MLFKSEGHLLHDGFGACVRRCYENFHSGD